jgi:phospholipid/cholesterol/gamma-HCH transport system ATP-binding protein
MMERGLAQNAAAPGRRRADAIMAAMDADYNIVDIRGLRFSYGERVVLRGVDLAIKRGRIAAILGTSGSGKTTLLQLMAGSLEPAAGHIEVCGREVPELDRRGLYALRRDMGMMFQKGGLFSDLSVFENIAFPMRELTDLPDSIVRDLVVMKLNAVGLRGAQNLMPAELSGGMARRVALARAIALDPELIIYDEPFAGLDPITLNVICNLIRTLNGALGATSVIVTYDVREAVRLADHLYLLNDGVIVGEGPTQEMVASNDPFVHQFLHAEPDGPVRFHFPAPALADDLALAPMRVSTAFRGE